MENDDLIVFAHGITSAVAATTVWEVMRAALDGAALLIVGGIASGVVLHIIHWHHVRLLRKRRPHRAVRVRMHAREVSHAPRSHRVSR